MKKLILLLSLCASFSVFAQEAGWKSSLRGMLTNVVGVEWSNKLLGSPPQAAPEMALPEIPNKINKSTDVEAYKVVKKDQTEYERLPEEKKRRYDYMFVEELFKVTRRTEAKDEDLSTWLNALDQGGSREGIYQALVLDEVYSAMENMDEKPSRALVDFTLNLSQKFLNQTFKEESINQLNLYSLKRILTERGLDLMENFETSDLDAFYRWYAVFSADLAKAYPSLLKTQVRSDTSPLYHYEWAKSMPIQHIKSEFIIKLHAVMNGLQEVQ